MSSCYNVMYIDSKDTLRIMTTDFCIGKKKHMPTYYVYVPNT